jgi:serine/threonine protein kinase
MAKSRHGSREGTILAGKYRIESLLGAGGMGEVYRAENTTFGRVVAIKMLREEYAESPEVVDRFKREAQAANIVRHPNVVDILDIGQADDGTPFIVQEFLEGQDLAAYAHSLGGRLSADEAVALLTPVVDAVAFAHERSVLHRDLKPENIFLARTANGVVPKLLDFGISRIMTAEEQRMTATGMSIGTPAYMSPEQIRADKVIDARSDVWSIGVILHELLSGSLPFQSEAQSGLFVKIVTEPPVPLDVAAPGTPQAMVAIVDRCLRAKADERYASAADLARDLRAFQGGTASRVDARAPVPSKRVSAPKVDMATMAAVEAPGDAAGPRLMVPDLALPAPKLKPQPRPAAQPGQAPPSASMAGGGGRMVSSHDISDEIIPMSESLQLDNAPPMRAVIAPPVARASKGLRHSVEEDPNDGARSLFAMGIMWALVLGITGAMTTLIPGGGLSVGMWATRLDGMPQVVSGGVAGLVVALGVAAFVAGVRSQPTSWGLVIASPGMILDGIILAGFAVHGFPCLTGNTGLDALARLFFPWPTMLVPLGLSLVVFRSGWHTWNSRRPGRTTNVALAIVIAACLLFGAVEIVRGAGDMVSQANLGS